MIGIAGPYRLVGKTSIDNLLNQIKSARVVEIVFFDGISLGMNGGYLQIDVGIFCGQRNGFFDKLTIVKVDIRRWQKIMS